MYRTVCHCSTCFIIIIKSAGNVHRWTWASPKNFISTGRTRHAFLCLWVINLKTFSKLVNLLLATLRVYCYGNIFFVISLTIWWYSSLCVILLLRKYIPELFFMLAFLFYGFGIIGVWPSVLHISHCKNEC